MAIIICTESGLSHEYGRDTYDTMCQYDAIDCKTHVYDTIASEKDAKWWHEYERVMNDCQAIADEKGLTVGDVANELGVDFSDLGADMDKIAEWLDVRPMFEEQA